eukprot:13944291-Ditylum_brightwellii.AAC.1
MEVYDDPTLIWTVLTLLKPSRNVGVQAEIKAIKAAQLLEYGNNTYRMLDNMETKFNQIKASSGLICCNSPTMHRISVHYSVPDFVNHIALYQVVV